MKYSPLKSTMTFDLEMYCDHKIPVMVHSRLLEIASCDRLQHRTSYSHSIVTLALTCTFVRL